MMETAVIIANPTAGKAQMRALESSLGMFEARGIKTALTLTTHRGHAQEIAQAAKGCKMVIACGGDGTINEAINGLAGTQTALAIVPMGTANVLANEIGIPFNIELAIEAALTRQAHTIALGRVDASGISRHFSLMCGVGYDAQTVLGVSGGTKRLLGKGAYILSGTRVLATWRPDAIRIRVDGVPHICHSFIISKARLYAGDFVLAPEADISEPYFIVTLIEGSLRRDITRLTMGIVSGSGVRAQGITQMRCQKIELSTPSHMQIDGDYLGHSEAIFTVMPEALRLVY